MSAAITGAEVSIVARIFAALKDDGFVADTANAIVPVYGRRKFKAALPYIEVGDTLGTDWSVKGAKGREVRVSVIIHDAPEMLDRARDLAEQIEYALGSIARDEHGWRLASFVFVKSMIDRSEDNRWRVFTDWRARLLRTA